MATKQAGMSREEREENKVWELREAEAWVDADPGHGSARLRKAHKLGLLGQSMTVYREERLGLELGAAWRFLKPNDRLEDVVNPTYKDMGRLEAIREDHPKAELRFLRCKVGEQRPATTYVVLRISFLDRDAIQVVREVRREPVDDGMA